MTAYRVHLAQLTAGHQDEATPQAEAGALLEAEAAYSLIKLREMYKRVHP